MHSHDNAESLLRVLTAPRRNQFFYGKRMDVQHFRMEQDYGKLKQWLLNRLSLGKGVLCGLKVTVDGNRVCVDPGVAIDGLGREIVVPVRACFDPLAVGDSCCSQHAPAPAPMPAPTAVPAPPSHHSTDIAGIAAPAASAPSPSLYVRPRPSSVYQPQDAGPGWGANGDVFTLWLYYRECTADYQPVLVSDCESRSHCAGGTTVESFCLKATPGLPPLQDDPDWCANLWPKNEKPSPNPNQPAEPTSPAPPAQEHVGSPLVLTDVDRKALIEAHRSRRHLLCELFDDACDPGESDPYVPLALVRVRDGRLVVESCLVRPRIYSNQQLLDLILCLADKIEDCCGRDTGTAALLRYVSGDGQQGRAGQALKDPLVVQVLLNGAPAAGQTVNFEVQSGGGSIGATATTLSTRLDVVSDVGGNATLPIWKLGPAAGENRVRASLASGGTADVQFRATAAEALNLPVVTGIEYLNTRGEVIAAQQNAMSFISIKRGDQPAAIRISFSKEINPGTVSTMDTTVDESLAPTGAPALAATPLPPQIAAALGDPSLAATALPVRSVLIVRSKSAQFPTRAFIGGKAKADGKTITFTVGGEEWLEPGPDRSYVMALSFSGGIEDTDGHLLDGDFPDPNDWHLPSGDGVEGGPFLAPFQIIDGDPATPVSRARLQVSSIDFLHRDAASGETLVASVTSPLDRAAVPIDGLTNAIRIRFNRAVEQRSTEPHRPSTPNNGDPDFARHNVLVLPDGAGPNAPPYVPGSLVMEAPETLRFDLAMESAYSRGADGWQKGNYLIFLRGSDNVPAGRPALVDAATATPLDGDPIAPIGGLISGDGSVGGDFKTRFKVG